MLFSLFFFQLSFNIERIKLKIDNTGAYVLAQPSPPITDVRRRKREKSKRQIAKRSGERGGEGRKEEEKERERETEGSSERGDERLREGGRNREGEGEGDGVDWSEGNWNERFQRIMGQVNGGKSDFRFSFLFSIMYIKLTFVYFSLNYISK